MGIEGAGTDFRAGAAPPCHGRTARLLLGAVAVVVLYANAALLANATLKGLSVRARVPIPFLVRGLFDVFPVFVTYETRNTEIVLLGLPEGADANDDSAWIELDVAEYFPYRLGERQARILSPTRGRSMGGTSLPQGWSILLRKVRQRYNRQQPERRLTRLRLRQRTWPRSADGFRAGERPGEIATADLYAEP